MPSEFKPDAAIYTDEKTVRKVYKAGVIGVTLTGITILVAIILLLLPAGPWTQPFMLLMAAAWAIGGPAWFFYEYFFIYRSKGAADSWELFKHGQQVSAAVWVALTASLAAVGNSDFVKPAGIAYSCKPDKASSAASSASAPVNLNLVCIRKD
jgi:hypothetical protein